MNVVDDARVRVGTVRGSRDRRSVGGTIVLFTGIALVGTDEKPTPPQYIDRTQNYIFRKKKKSCTQYEFCTLELGSSLA